MFSSEEAAIVVVEFIGCKIVTVPLLFPGQPPTFAPLLLHNETGVEISIKNKHYLVQMKTVPEI